MTTRLDKLIDRVNAAHTELKNARNLYNQHVTSMPGQVWLDRIMKIEDEQLRIHVAQIVWWDYQCPELETLIMKWNKTLPVPRQNLIDGLVQAGYPRNKAKFRLRKYGFNR